MNKFLIKLVDRHPELKQNEASIEQAFGMICRSLENNGTLFICGNGGSAADAEHITGELLKGFMKKRPLSAAVKQQYSKQFGREGLDIASKLQGGVKAVALTSHPAFGTAFLNDVDGSLIYGQQLNALGSPGDVLLGISCSGNAENVRKAMMVARMKGIKTILLTGCGNGSCVEVSDCVIGVPCRETFMIQEYHLPIYHALCMMIEDHFYDE
jgi:D-sedoheptulose 7-phosphate isomerase